MAYPLLYGAAASLLPILDNASYFPQEYRKNVEQWKEALNSLPSTVETDGISNEGLNSISEFVYGLHDTFCFPLLALKFTKFQEGLHPPKNRESEKSLLSSSLSDALSSNESPYVKLKLKGVPPHLVPCLAYCALYPEGSIFVRETLVNHWMAQGFLGFVEDSRSSRLQRGSSSGGLELEDIGNNYFDELLHRWGVFVQPTFVFGGHHSGDKQAATVHSCKLDPLVHRAARHIASNEVVILSDAIHGSAAAATARHIASHKETRNIPSEHHWRPSITYMCFTPQISDQVGLHRLRVLDLAGTQFEKLPTSDSLHPSQLRYLGLSRNTLLQSLDLDDFPNLQTAAFDGCVHLKKLRSFIQMPKLRHLYYTSKATKLWFVEPYELRILQVSHCPELISLEFEFFSQEILIRRLGIFECPRLVTLSIVNLLEAEELIFHNCARLDLNSRAYSLPCVRYMEIIGLPKLTRLPDGLRDAGNSIRYLMIADCISLRSMDYILQHLKSLVKLRIYSCRNLWIVPSVFQSLTVLQSLDIRKCPKITATWTTDAAPTDVAPFISHIPDIILDGQRPSFDQKDVGAQKLTSSAQPSSNLPRDFPYFVLSSETFKTAKSSEGTLDLEYKLRTPNYLAVMALGSIAIVRFNRLVQQSESRCYSFLRLFHSDEFEFEFERDKLFQLWKGLRVSSNFNFDRLLEEEFIIYSRTDILTGISKYKINVEKVTTFSNMVKSEVSATYAAIDDEIAADVDISKVTHVSVVSKNINQTSLFKTLEGMTGLRTFLLIRDYGSSLNQIPSTFFKTHQFMAGLDLSGSHISELPSSLGEMKQLRFLDLSYTLIQRIPESIHHLGKLQTLKLKECKKLHSLPKGMKQLTSLCDLDFDVLGQLTCMPEGIGVLTQLCTLSAFIVSGEDGCTLRELERLNNLGGSFCISGLEYATEADAQKADMESKRYLSRLHLKWNESISYDRDARYEAFFTLKGLRMYPVKELQISYYPGLALPKWIYDFDLEQLVSVTFHRSDIESMFALDRLPNLKDINFIDMDRVKRITSNHVRFYYCKIRYPKLETLTIDGMVELKNWTGVEKNDCPCLSKLRVKHCPKLTQLDFLPHLCSLKYLEISYCYSFTSLPNGGLPASLETLVIYQCHFLKTTCSKGGGDWEKIKHVPYIWIDMKGIGSANDEPDSDENSDYSDEDSECNGDTLTP